MLEVTDLARSKIRAIMESEGDPGNLIRVDARKVAPYRFEYDIYFIDAEEMGEHDIRHDVGGIVFVADPSSAANLEGATIDFVEGPPGGFKFDNPNAKQHFDDPLEAELNDFIEAQINPRLAAHRGYILLHGIKDQIVYVEMGGSCQGCGLAAMTMRQGVESQIRERFPDVVEIVDVTNHDEGTNPFYRRT